MISITLPRKPDHPFHKWLQDRRKNRGFASRHAAAKAAGFEAGHYSHWEKGTHCTAGRKPPTPEDCRGIARMLELEFDEVWRRVAWAHAEKAGIADAFEAQLAEWNDYAEGLQAETVAAAHGASDARRRLQEEQAGRHRDRLLAERIGEPRDHLLAEVDALGRTKVGRDRTFDVVRGLLALVATARDIDGGDALADALVGFREVDDLGSRAALIAAFAGAVRVATSARVAALRAVGGVPDRARMPEDERLGLVPVAVQRAVLGRLAGWYRAACGAAYAYADETAEGAAIERALAWLDHRDGVSFRGNGRMANIGGDHGPVAIFRRPLDDSRAGGAGLVRLDYFDEPPVARFATGQLDVMQREIEALLRERTRAAQPLTEDGPIEPFDEEWTTRRG